MRLRHGSTARRNDGGHATLLGVYACPHCSAASISGWRKANSSPLFPVRCRACGGKSVASGWSRWIYAFGAELILYGSIVFAFVVRSAYGLLIYPLAIAALIAGVNHAFPLVAMDKRQAMAQRRAIRFFVVLAVAFLLVAATAWVDASARPAADSPTSSRAK